MADEKFPNAEVERLKLAARVEETLPEADRCPACAADRKRTGDPTWLCADHLKRIYGV